MRLRGEKFYESYQVLGARNTKCNLRALRSFSEIIHAELFELWGAAPAEIKMQKCKRANRRVERGLRNVRVFRCWTLKCGNFL